MKDKEKYILEYRFGISNTRRLAVDKKQLPFDIPSGKAECSLKSFDSNKFIDETNELIIKCKNIETYNKAQELVYELQNALFWFVLRSDVNIYEHKNKGYINPKIFDDYKPEDVDVINDDKIAIYKDLGKKIQRVKTGAEYHVKMKNDKEYFEKYMFEGMTKNYLNEDKQEYSIVLELYNRATGEVAKEISFLLLITIIEILSDRDLEYEEDVKKTVQELKKFVNETELPHNQKQKLMSRIGRLKKKSIQDSCIQLLIDYQVFEGDLDDDQSIESFIKDAYDIRSSFVHKGNINNKITEKKFRKMYGDLKKVVKKLLVNYF